MQSCIEGRKNMSIFKCTPLKKAILLKKVYVFINIPP